jgi:hypothetical protein
MEPDYKERIRYSIITNSGILDAIAGLTFKIEPCPWI